MHRALVAVALSACAPAAPDAVVEPVASPAPAAPPAPAPAAAPEQGSRCGALECRQFDSAALAFSEILAAEPRVLAIGEAHAQKGSEEVPSSTKRFREELLPLVKERATDLVIELMVAEGDCKLEQERVAQAQKPVVERQAASNQNEFVLLGEASSALGVRPHVLRPSCDDYKAVLAAGDDSIPRMLTMIAALTGDLVQRILERNQKRGVDKLVVAYGGALHNDLAPAAGREGWSFGPRLAGLTGGRYVELDLIVPEFIKDNDSWRAMAWYPHYDRKKHGKRVTLFRTAPGSYTLVFAASR